MPLMFAGKKIPGALIVGAHWFAFAAISAVVWLVAGG
jgi:hypothetical protein